MEDWEMTQDEIGDQRQIQREIADALLARARTVLEQEGLEILDFSTTPKLCYKCPEYPNECHDCRRDRNMSENLQPQIMTLVVAEIEAA